MAGLDRILRILIAVVFGVLFFNNIVTGTLGIILLIVGVVFLITAIVGFCPLYRLLGISTKKSK